MFTLLFNAFILLAACVVIHMLTLAALLRYASRYAGLATFRFWPATRMLVQFAWWIILAHLAEIIVWAFFYTWRGVFPGFETSAYFSAVTYTTVGYGDLVPPLRWRLLSGVEGLTGILMCGCSAGFFFAVVSRIFLGRAVEAGWPGRSVAR
jgi:voltage-gated potassium channel Kch